jgi:glycosyltransferase involved in cell wall biosynthesis
MDRDPAAAAEGTAHRPRYCLVTPCRDEARFARRTLDAVVRQTAPPALWVIVDDGSRDETPRILAEYAARHPFIRVVTRPDRGARKVGGGVVDAFYAGYDAVHADRFEYVCKLDLDLDLPPRYFEALLARMEADPRLGTASGKAYYRWPAGAAPQAPARFPLNRAAGLVSEGLGDENSAGMVKLYRAACFRQIGGFVREVMWDGIDGHRCRQLGWIAASWDDPELRFLHLRPMGTSHRSWWTGCVRAGYGQWFMGTSPAYLVASAVHRTVRRPRVVGAAGILYGYFRSALRGTPRFEAPGFRAFLRRYQWACLLRGKRAATGALNARQAGVWRPAE